MTWGDLKALMASVNAPDHTILFGVDDEGDQVPMTDVTYSVELRAPDDTTDPDPPKAVLA